MPLIVVCVEAATPPVIPPVTTGALQAYVVLAGTILLVVPFTGVIAAKAVPLQVDAV